MTSAEKIAELRQAVAAAIADRDRDPSLAIVLGTWEFLPGFMRRRVLESLPLPDLDDHQALDELLGLIAGVALELHSDGGPADTEDIAAYRTAARGLLEQVRGAGA